MYDHLIGIPYDEKNCWDIVVDFYNLVFNISLHDYYTGPNPGRDVTKNLIYSSAGEFEKVDKPKFGDIIIMKVHGIESHIGVYLDSSRLLHSTARSGCVIDRLSRWEKLVVGYYRVKA